MAPILAAIDPKVAAALIAGGVSLVVTGATLVFSPISRWLIEHDLSRRKAEYDQELEALKARHQTASDIRNREHAEQMQRATAEAQRLLEEGSQQAALELARRKADIDYEVEQRRALRHQVGSFRGRLIEVGSSLNFRLDNMRENISELVGEESTEKWLNRQGKYRRDEAGGYYFVSTVYRFMALVAVANRFERAAIYVDPRYGEPADEQVVFYVRALRWTLTDPKLFAGLPDPYEQHEATDHFFTDDLRMMCGEITRADGELKELHEVEPALRLGGSLEPVLRFFDGLEPSSLKWDRLMAFGLVLKAFLNSIGYLQTRSTQHWFDITAASIGHPEVRRNLQEWLPRLAIDSGDPAEHVRTAINHAEQGSVDRLSPSESDPGDGAEPQA